MSNRAKKGASTAGGAVEHCVSRVGCQYVYCRHVSRIGPSGFELGEVTLENFHSRCTLARLPSASIGTSSATTTTCPASYPTIGPRRVGASGSIQATYMPPIDGFVILRNVSYTIIMARTVNIT